jgi:hypothetical protein
MDRLTGRQLGTYQILGRLGAGGMGEVDRAKDLKLGRDVAIKVLPDRFTSDPHRLARFEREARLLAVRATASPLFEHAPLAAPGMPIARYDVARQGFLTVEHKTEFTKPVVRVVEHWLSEFQTTAEQGRK